MPLYDYICAEHGVFQDMAPVSRFSEPCACPVCGMMSKRALTVPQLSTVAPLARKAHAVNERSADSPKRAKANGLTPSGPRIRSKARTHQDGSKSMPSSRPWMLSH
ncbi:MAG: FmdB family zinc ribbon protein [Pseudomonadota bacterium]